MERTHRQPPSEADLVSISGGRFLMGCDGFYPEESPVRLVDVDPFFIQRTPVTNRSFGRFVDATGYETVAERALRSEDYPDADPDLLQPASMVFAPPPHPASLRDPSQWWRLIRGANWRLPFGPKGRPALPDHPVVHIALEDADAYASWAGLRLPTEAEWEFAARGRLKGAVYAWGDCLHPDGRRMANTWRGDFPSPPEDDPTGFGTTPVGAFPANDFGLFDMIGNVWEWTDDYFASHKDTVPPKSCCALNNPRNRNAQASLDRPRGGRIPRKVLKGGSFMCAPNYCRRYRPAARHPQDIDTGASHIGFRCVRSINESDDRRATS